MPSRRQQNEPEKQSNLAQLREIRFRRSESRLGAAIVLTLLWPTALSAQVEFGGRVDPPIPVHLGGPFSSLARGDFDGNGTLDLAIGQPALGLPGQVLIESGGPGTVTRVFRASVPVPGEDGFGKSVLAVPDLDGDGATDLVIGVPIAASGPRIEARSGATGATIWVRSFSSLDLLLGWSFAFLGDITGDGVSELIVGGPSRCSILQSTCPPTADGIVAICNGSDGSVLQVISSGGTVALRPRFGACVAGPGDLDGDGFPDVLATSGPAPGVMSFETLAFSGASGAFLGVLSQSNGASGLPSLIAHSDVNGDGVSDIISVRRNPALSPNRSVECMSGTGSGALWSHLTPGTDSIVRSLDDLNLDGHPEVLVVDRPNSNEAQVTILSGFNGLPAWSVAMPQFSGQSQPPFGIDASPTRDMDGDGINDSAVITAAGNVESTVYYLSSLTGATLGQVESDFGVDGFGASIIRTSDFDGDGVRDVLVGSPRGNTPERRNCGLATLFSGALGTPLRSFSGPLASSGSGVTLAELGDVDGDSVPDFVLGAPYLAALPPLPGTGRIDAVSGATGALLWSASSQSTSRMLGAAMQVVPDRNGDGIADLAAAEHGNNQSQPGFVRILDGTNGATIQSLSPPNASSSFGAALALAGDLNGDGVRDLVVGDPGGVAVPYIGITSPITINPPIPIFALGRVRAFSGVNGTLLWTSSNPATNGRFGWQIVPLDDLNSDGVSDLAISEPNFGASSATSVEGRVQIVSGADGAILRTAAVGVTGEFFGYRLTELADLDGDSKADWAGIATFAASSGLPNVTRHRLRAFSSATDQLLWTGQSSTYPAVGVSDGFGFAVTSLGDLNGDGFQEVAVGVPNGYSPNGVASRGYIGLFSPSVAPTVVPFGSACSLTFGGTTYTPTMGSSGGPASISTGNPSFAITIQGAPPSALAALFYGVPAPSWNGLPLPLDLTSFGLPGCILEVSPQNSVLVSLSGSSPPGSLTLPAPLLPNPTLSGTVVLAQWAIQIPSAISPQIALTNALRITLN